MKTTLQKAGILLCLLLFQTVWSQQKVDTVIMLNGEEHKGTVMAIEAETISFIYEGESLQYTFQKAEINKIVFSSGRTQVFTEKVSETDTLQNALDAKGKLAVIPFSMTSNEPTIATEAMGEDIQHAAIESFNKNTAGITMVDPVKVNAILLKNGITSENIKQYLPKELAAILGVEYVVYGAATITYEGSGTYGNTNTSYKDKEEKEKSKTKSSGNEHSSTYSSTTNKYDTNVEIIIYNNKGEKLYSVKRNSFGSSLDTYKGTLNYLIKRSPWGSKHK